jgi:hypothetical protein
MIVYYDVVLGLIPLALIGITGALSLAGLSLTASVPVGATVAVGLMGHAMFVRAPVDAEPAAAVEHDSPVAPNGD